MSSAVSDPSPLASRVEAIVSSTPVADIHTHLYDPAFGDLLLWGIDDVLVYHYLVAEAFRWMDVPYEKFWPLSKARQAELIWDALFVRHSPVSEACRGVITTLNALGIDARKGDLPATGSRRSFTLRISGRSFRRRRWRMTWGILPSGTRAKMPSRIGSRPRPSRDARAPNSRRRSVRTSMPSRETRRVSE